MTSDEKAKIIADAMDDKKAQNIVILDVAEHTSIAEKFVLCSCTSSTQVKACADNAEFKVSEAGEKVHHIEGYAGGSWILLDFGDVVAHVMTEETREFYDIERLY
ncbi:MAG: ribosome silencing factor [Clostridia bacterium]|nr:ribosome silencing factor [Clostridia bacterium]